MRHIKTNTGVKFLLVCLLVVLNACAHKVITKQNIEKANADSPEPSYWTVEKAKEHLQMVPSSKREYYGTTFFLRGLTASYDGFARASAEAFKIALIYDPDEPVVMTKLAGELVKIGEAEQALLVLENALKLDPKNVETLLLYANVLSTTEDKEKAIEQYKKILKITPENVEVQILRATLYVDMGKIKKGKKLLKDVTNSYSSNPIPFYYLGRVELQDENLSGAIQAFKKAFELNQRFVQAGTRLAAIYEEKSEEIERRNSGPTTASRKYRKKAYEIYETLFSNGEISAAPYVVSYLIEEQDYVRVEAVLRKLGESDPTDYSLQSRLGLILVKNGKLDEAEEIFRNILKAMPNAEKASFYLGSVLMERGKSDEAIKAYRNITPESKLFTQTAIQIADLLAKSKSQEASEQWLNEALEMNKNKDENIFLHRFLAGVQSDQGRDKDALDTLKKVYENYSDDEGYLYQLAVLYETNGDWVSAESTVKKILDTNPKHAHALNFLGYSYLVRGDDLKLAEKYILQAVEHAPEDGQIRDSVGWLFYKLGKFKKAVKELEIAVGILGNTHLEVTEHLGKAYLKISKRKKAIELYKKALAESTEDNARSRIQAWIDGLERGIASEESSESAKK